MPIVLGAALAALVYLLVIGYLIHSIREQRRRKKQRAAWLAEFRRRPPEEEQNEYE